MTNPASSVPPFVGAHIQVRMIDFTQQQSTSSGAVSIGQLAPIPVLPATSFGPARSLAVVQVPATLTGESVDFSAWNAETLAEIAQMTQAQYDAYILPAQPDPGAAAPKIPNLRV